MFIKLTNSAKRKLESEHRSCRDKRKCDRIKAILLNDEGWNISQISQALRIHETSVLRHLKEFENDKNLMPKNGGSESLLS